MFRHRPRKSASSGDIVPGSTAAFRRRHRPQVLLVLILLLGVVLCILAIRYEAKHQIAGLDRTPSIELRGDSSLNAYVGDLFTDPGYHAERFDGTDLTSDVEVSFEASDKGNTEDSTDASDALDTDGTLQKPGDYTITYTVTDSGNTVRAKRTLHVTFPKPDPDDPDYGHSIAVCMYHNVYDPENPPEGLNNNYISTTDLEAHLQYLIDNGYYFPTWQELRDYLDGKIDLPLKSVVLTFDDCTKAFQEYGIPILEEYDVRATSFVICAKNGEEVLKKYKDVKHITFQSHSYNMHRPGGSIGHGGIFTALSVEDGVSDLEQSIDMLGSGDAFAYPFGDYNETAEEAVREAGFLCAFTTEYGKVAPGDDPLLLPRIRINLGMSAEEFAETIEWVSLAEEDSDDADSASLNG